MPKTVFYQDSDAIFKFEESFPEVLLHCEVFNWAPSVLKRAYRVLGDFMNQKRKEGFERMVTATPNPKFAKLFGGDTIAYLDHEGKEYEVIVWELKQQSS